MIPHLVSSYFVHVYVCIYFMVCMCFIFCMRFDGLVTVRLILGLRAVVVFEYLSMLFLCLTLLFCVFHTIWTDIVIEQFIGFEIYQLIKKSTCQEALLRVLIVKWLYVQGVLQSDFPPTKERFIPAHMREDFE